MLDMKTANAMRLLRDKMGITQQQLADDIGSSRPSISAVERGTVKTIAMLDGYVTAMLGKSLSEILLEEVNSRYGKLQGLAEKNE